MRFGLIISILLHAIMIGFLLVTIQRSMPFLPTTEEIPVEVVTVAEEANVKAATKETKPEEEKPAPTPAPAPPPAATPEPPSPEPEAAPPAPKPTEEAEKPKEEPKKAEVQPRARPTPPTKAEKPKQDKFDLDAISVLIDKSKKAQNKREQTAESAPSDTSAEEPRQSVGAGDDMTITLQQLMQRQVEACWSFPAGAVQPEDLDVYITIYLRADGTLSEPPQIDNQGRMSDPYFRAAAEAAMRAVTRCQPYDLPEEQYDIWKQGFRLNFDPRKMVGIGNG